MGTARTEEIMGLQDYDDMMGLEFGDFDAIFPMGFLKEVGISAAAGGVGLLATSYSLQKLASMSFMPSDPAMKSRIMSLGAVVIGTGLGRGLYNYNREAAMGVVGAVAGVGLANLIGSFLDTNPLGKPLGVLPEDMALSTSPDSALLAQYDQYAMNGLSSPGVAVSAPAFAAFADPTVTPEALQGFASPMVQMETLGAYQPWNS